MSILTLLLAAFVFGLLAGKMFDLFKTVLVKLRHIRVEIDLGSDKALATRGQSKQSVTLPDGRGSYDTALLRGGEVKNEPNKASGN